jgi:hypothetical protein
LEWCWDGRGWFALDLASAGLMPKCHGGLVKLVLHLRVVLDAMVQRLKIDGLTLRGAHERFIYDVVSEPYLEERRDCGS